MFLNCWVNPFYIREASLEHNINRKVNKTLSVVLMVFALLIILIFVIQIIDFKIFIKIDYILLLFFYILSQVLIYICKLTFRIQDKINIYAFVLILEKLFFLVLIIFYFQLTKTIKIEIIIKILSYSYFFIAIIFMYPLLKDFKFKLPYINLLTNYLKSSSYIFFATIFVYFTSYEYLMIILNESDLKIIITYLAIGYMFSNFIYMPVYWLEQLISPKINIIFNSGNNIYKIKYYKDICLYFLNFTYLIQLILINLFTNSNILELLFDETFIKNIYYVIIIIFVSTTKLIDTLFSIPIFARKLEKKILLFNIFKVTIFLYFYLFLNVSKDDLIIIFILLSFLQNFYYLFLNLKLVNNYFFYNEIFYLLVNIFGLFLFLYTNFFIFFSVIISFYLIFNLISKKLSIVNKINQIIKFN